MQSHCVCMHRYSQSEEKRLTNCTKAHRKVGIMQEHHMFSPERASESMRAEHETVPLLVALMWMNHLSEGNSTEQRKYKLSHITGCGACLQLFLHDYYFLQSFIYVLNHWLPPYSLLFATGSWFPLLKNYYLPSFSTLSDFLCASLSLSPALTVLLCIRMNPPQKKREASEAEQISSSCPPSPPAPTAHAHMWHRIADATQGQLDNTHTPHTSRSLRYTQDTGVKCMRADTHTHTGIKLHYMSMHITFTWYTSYSSKVMVATGEHNSTTM